jgi:hypothetical protein
VAEHRQTIDLVIKELDDLLPKRNMIVHGITREVGFGDDEPRAYRIDSKMGGLDYLNEFGRQTGNVEYSFPVERVRQATNQCRDIASKIGPITTHLVNLHVSNADLA